MARLHAALRAVFQDSGRAGRHSNSPTRLLPSSADCFRCRRHTPIEVTQDLLGSLGLAVARWKRGQSSNQSRGRFSAFGFSKAGLTMSDIVRDTVIWTIASGGGGADAARPASLLDVTRWNDDALLAAFERDLHAFESAHFGRIASRALPICAPEPVSAASHVPVPAVSGTSSAKGISDSPSHSSAPTASASDWVLPASASSAVSLGELARQRAAIAAAADKCGDHSEAASSTGANSAGFQSPGRAHSKAAAMHDYAGAAESHPSTVSAEEGTSLSSSDALSFESWRSQWYAWYAASGFDPSQREQYLEQVLAASLMGAASESSSALQAADQLPRTNESSATSNGPIPGPTSNGSVVTNTPSASNAVVTIAESDLHVRIRAF